MSIYQVNFFKENLRVFRNAALPLFGLVIVSNSIDQYLSLQVEQALQNPLGATQQVYFFGFLSILSSIIFPVFLITLALFPFSQDPNVKGNLGSFLDKYLNQMFIESLRSWGKTLLWSLFFIVPGIWKYLEFCMVPFIVTSSKKYDIGALDALDASSTIFRHRWKKVLSILFLFHLFIPLVLTALFDSYRVLWKTPLASLALSLIDTYFLLISTQLLYTVFQSEVAKHESHV